MRASGSILGVVAIAAFASVPGTGTAQSPAAFYKDKQVEFIIGSATGSTYDAWARVIARHMVRHVPGTPSIIPKNMPGAGHIKATNYLFNIAPKDGTSIGMFSRNMPTRALLNHPAVRFKSEEFIWIGSPELTNRVCAVMDTSPIKSGEDAFKREIIVGGAGAGGAVSTTPLVLKGALGMNFRLVEGYKGTADIYIAMERGELHGICTGLSGLRASTPGWMESGKLRVLFNLERKPVPGLNAPTIYQFIKTEEQRQIIGFYSSSTELGRPVAAPPGTPADRVDALRRAFDATMKDPAFLAETTKLKLEINALTGEELTERILDLAKTPLAIVNRTEALLGPKEKKSKKKKKSEE